MLCEFHINGKTNVAAFVKCDKVFITIWGSFVSPSYRASENILRLSKMTHDTQLSAEYEHKPF